jgi:hypothetical protein
MMTYTRFMKYLSLGVWVGGLVLSVVWLALDKDVTTPLILMFAGWCSYLTSTVAELRTELNTATTASIAIIERLPLADEDQ